MSVDLNRVIEQVSKEKGIDKSIVINAVEEMMHSAARRTFGPERNIESRYNTEIGEVELFEIKTVVERVANPAWAEYFCQEHNTILILQKETYFIREDGVLMPSRKDQPPPDLRKFTQTGN